MRKREILNKMTNKELLDKLNDAQNLLSDVFHWASEIKPANGKLMKNSAVAQAMSCADSCIYEAIELLDGNE
jgi:hypothetical protein